MFFFQDALDGYSMHQLRDGRTLVLNHNEKDVIQMHDLGSKCSDWKLTKNNTAGKHLGELFIHSLSQSAKSMWVPKLKFSNMDEADVRFLKAELMGVESVDPKPKVEEKKSQEAKYEEQKKLEQIETEAKRKKAEEEQAKKEADELERKKQEAKKKSEAEALCSPANTETTADAVRKQIEAELREKIEKELLERQKLQGAKAPDQGEEDLNQGAAKMEEDEKGKKAEEEEKVKKAEEEEKAKKAEDEKAKMAEETQKQKKAEADEKARLQKEADELRKAKAARIEDDAEEVSSKEADVVEVSTSDIVKANKEKALKRKEDLQTHERNAKKVKMPSWGRIGLIGVSWQVEDTGT